MDLVIDPRIATNAASKAPEAVDLTDELDLKPAISRLRHERRSSRLIQFAIPQSPRRGSARPRESARGSRLAHSLKSALPEGLYAGKPGIEFRRNGCAENVPDSPIDVGCRSPWWGCVMRLILAIEERSEKPKSPSLHRLLSATPGSSFFAVHGASWPPITASSARVRDVFCVGALLSGPPGWCCSKHDEFGSGLTACGVEDDLVEMLVTKGKPAHQPPSPMCESMAEAVYQDANGTRPKWSFFSCRGQHRVPAGGVIAEARDPSMPVDRLPHPIARAMKLPKPDERGGEPASLDRFDQVRSEEPVQVTDEAVEIGCADVLEPGLDEEVVVRAEDFDGAAVVGSTRPGSKPMKCVELARHSDGADHRLADEPVGSGSVRLVQTVSFSCFSRSASMRRRRVSACSRLRPLSSSSRMALSSLPSVPRTLLVIPARSGSPAPTLAPAPSRMQTWRDRVASLVLALQPPPKESSAGVAMMGSPTLGAEAEQLKT